MEEKINESTNTQDSQEEIQGRLKWFDENKNYGFIVTADEKEIFVHRRNIPNFKQLNLLDGDEVTFETFLSKKGIQAKKVKKVKVEEVIPIQQSQKYFSKHVRKMTPIVLKIVGGKTAIGRIKEEKTYDVLLDIAQQEFIPIRKIDIKYLFQRKHQENVARILKINRDLKSKKVTPSEKIKDRYKIPNKVLMDAYAESREVTFTLCEGEILNGVINWFTKYEILLRVHRNASVCLFRHSIIDYKIGDPVPPSQEEIGPRRKIVRNNQRTTNRRYQ